jgi:hypothetical protein
MPGKAQRKELMRQAAMREAVEWLRRHGVPFDQPSDHHLKIGRVNYWPATGTVMRDGDCGPFKVPGLDGLARVLGLGGAGRGSSRRPAAALPGCRSASPEDILDLTLDQAAAGSAPEAGGLPSHGAPRSGRPDGNLLAYPGATRRTGRR